MKTKILIILLFCSLSNLVIAQEMITGEKNPCPGEAYQYFFDMGRSCDGNITWEVQDGYIESNNSNSITVRWNKEIVDNGRWKIRAIYTPRGLGGTCLTSTFIDIPIKVKAVSAYNIAGDKILPPGYIGTKTYTAQIRNSTFPASSYMWKTNTGWTTTTTTPSVTLNFDNETIQWLEVVGLGSACQNQGIETRINISRITSFSGPDFICNEEIYVLTSPGDITLENATNVATLTKLDDNTYKITRIGTATGEVKLKSVNGENSYSKNILVGIPSLVNIVSNSGSNLQGGGTYGFQVDKDYPFTSINWVVTGGTILSGQGTNNILVKVDPNPFQVYNNLGISFQYTSNCGNGLGNKTFYVAPSGGTTPIDPGDGGPL
ncbi:hypothetical protein ACR79M_15810 [Sphingobacterium spiritivorum]|uniref:hypothetical protein n=1 Tax=Sphingobacterium spiritivorum TaxID=258 RepID=UPI003DA2C8B5